MPGTLYQWTTGQSPSQPLGLNMNITSYTHTHIHTRPPWSLRSQENTPPSWLSSPHTHTPLHDHSDLRSQENTPPSWLSSQLGCGGLPPGWPLWALSLLDFLALLPSAGRQNVLSWHVDTRPLWALRPHEMGCPGGNTVKYKYGAGWPLPHFLSFSATMGGPPLTSRGSRSVWAEFQEEAGSWRPCPQTNITGAWVSFVKAQWQWIPISIWVLGKTLGVLAKQAHAGGYPECLGSGAQAWPVCELLQGRPGLCCTAAAQHRARHTVRAHQPSVLVQPRNPILRALALF